MKNFLTDWIITASIIFAGIFMPLFASANFSDTDTDSVVSQSGNSIGASFGVSGYPDSLYITGNVSGTSETIISTTSSYTILSISILSNNNTGSAPNLTCDTNSFPILGFFNNFIEFSNSELPINSPFYTYNENAQHHCNSDLVLTDLNNTDTLYVQYVPYDTRMVQSTSTMPITDTHFGIIAEFAFAFAAFVLILWIFKRKI